MSFILDALKKSEKAHQRKRRPTLDQEFAPPSVQARTRFRRNSVLIISAALFLNAFFLLWWLRPWEPGAGSEHTRADAGKAVQSSGETPAAPSKTADEPRSQVSGAKHAEEAVNTPVAAAVPKAEPRTQLADTKQSGGVAGGPTPSSGVAVRPDAQAGSGASGGEKVIDTPTQPPPSKGEGAVGQAGGDRQIALSSPVPSKKEEKPERPAPRAADPPVEPVKSGGDASSPNSVTAGGPQNAPTKAAPPVKGKAGTQPPPAKLSERAPGAPPVNETSRAAEAKQAAGAAKPAQKKQAAAQSGHLSGTRELVIDLKELTGNENPSTKTAASRKALRFYELPTSVRDSMPRISVSMLTYSKQPANRWISINGSKMREGQEVTSGLKLEEITPDGAVFTYQGHRFYKAVIGD